MFLHPEHFEAAVAAGKHVYCEKPAGADVAGVRRVERAARAARPSQHLVFGFQQRYSPEYLAAEEVIASGRLGELLFMESRWVKGGASLRCASLRLTRRNSGAYATGGRIARPAGT